jgi:hypothetical protein
VSADPGTLSSELYASGVELLPGERADAGVARNAACEPPAVAGAIEGFERSCELFGSEVVWLASAEAGGLSHGELEERLQVNARELYRQMLEDHLERRAEQEQRIEAVVGADGVRRCSVERSHQRPLVTVFGEVGVRRFAYRARGRENLYPADAALNLPVEKHSHGLRRVCAIESARGSFQEACDATSRTTGQKVPPRQLQQLARCSAQDFESFYATRKRGACEPGEVLVLSCDGKGVVMRPDGLRDATRKQAQNHTNKLKTRLSRGEKLGRKRIAEVAAVYEIKPAPRTVADILPANDSERQNAKPAPEAKHKWLTASVSDDAATVVATMFGEAERRDPEHQRLWIGLVDGNKHQIDRINAEAKARKLTVTVLVDLIHVLEYLWKATWCFHREGDPAAELWVRDHAQQILAGNAIKVAGAIRRQATQAGLGPEKRVGADTCVTYLTNKHAYLDYPTALENGWPIATGVIEGACRHLVKDRMDITGARWGLPGAEAILQLRAIRSNGDFDEYWKYHLAQEQQRVHGSRYANAAIPQAA